ncbi:MAG: GNAT family N-acetyltransferase [Gemmatimonadaceae bacterium]
MSDRPTLHTSRLVLRPFVADDAPAVQRLAGDRDIASTTLNIPHPYEDGMAEAWIATHEDAFARSEGLTLAVTSRDDGALIGAVGIAINLRSSRAELGYWIGKPYWGRGYCTEAAAALVAYAFDVLDLNRVHATHLTWNPASGRVMRKIGMTYEGRLREHERKWGVFEDIEKYGILRREYQAAGAFSAAGAGSRSADGPPPGGGES